MEDDLRAYLLTRAVISSATQYTDGSQTKHRVYAADVVPQTFPTGVPHYPRITYQRITTSKLQHMRGASSLEDIRIQLDVYDKVKTVVNALADALEKLTGFQGFMDELYIEAVTFIDRMDMPSVLATDGSGKPILRTVLEFRFWPRSAPIPIHGD